MPDNPPDPADVIRARIQVLTEERERLGEEIGKLEHALVVLTTDQHAGKLDIVTTTAQRKSAAKAARKRPEVDPAVAKFAEAISKPHAGGEGYTIRSLAQKLSEAGYSCSHNTLNSILRGRFKADPKLAKRIRELTGYQLAADRIRDQS